MQEKAEAEQLAKEAREKQEQDLLIQQRDQQEEEEEDLDPLLLQAIRNKVAEIKEKMDSDLSSRKEELEEKLDFMKNPKKKK